MIRDAYTTGFNTVSIDFERLLSSLTISKDSNTNNKYELAYYKNAISIIENVVYAHDAERKWIQTHPVVLYESYIIQHIISRLSKKMNKNGKKLFSFETLSKQGQKFGDNLSVSLLCDDDIVYLIKNVFPDPLGEELFERRKRKHPIWKSEAEYKACFLKKISGGDFLEELEGAVDLTIKYLIKNTDSWVINENVIEKLEKERKEIVKCELDGATKKAQLDDKGKILKVMRSLEEYAKDKDIDCDFMLLKASSFNSGFCKNDFSDINVAFKSDGRENVEKFGEIASSLAGKASRRDRFFYLFYKRRDGENRGLIDDCGEICKKLVRDVVL